jgi:transcriptional regulator with XRE-family HTH domain
MTLQEALSNLMDREKMSQVRLSEVSGVAQSYISSLLSGIKQNPGGVVLAKLSVALNRKQGYLSQFLVLTDNAKPPIANDSSLAPAAVSGSENDNQLAGPGTTLCTSEQEATR